jgi:hypothetical protein
MESELCLLDVLEVMRCMLLCILEAAKLSSVFVVATFSLQSAITQAKKKQQLNSKRPGHGVCRPHPPCLGPWPYDRTLEAFVEYGRQGP